MLQCAKWVLISVIIIVYCVQGSSYTQTLVPADMGPWVKCLVHNNLTRQYFDWFYLDS